MNGIRVGKFSRADNARNIQIAVAASRRANADGLIGKTHVKRVPVCLGENSHGLDAEFFAREDDSERDFSTIRDEYFSEHGLSPPDGEQLFAVFHGLAVFNEDIHDLPRYIRFNL